MKCVGTSGVKRSKKGYRAIVTAAPGKLLLGGVKEHRSSVFCSRDLAKQWGRAILDNNRGAAIEYVTVYSKRRR